MMEQRFQTFLRGPTVKFVGRHQTPSFIAFEYADVEYYVF